MRKSILRCIALVAAGIFGLQAVAQMPPLPLDPAVRHGQFDNGLNYYIRYNNNPKGQADFYIAQRVGSVLEEENQRGLAHFLEHMCFNGTEHYPGNSLRDWLESVGVRFGYNLNAATGFDQTIYNISSVPTARQSVQDSCLLILRDWSCAVTLDPEEIEKERGVIHEEWRQSNKGQMRILEKLLPVVYAGNRYGDRLPIGTMEVVDNFPPQAIVDYYHTWYRPDLQAIIVVGDVDVDYIEGKIKELFSNIPLAENAKPREYFEVDDNEGTIYAIGSDPEMTAPSFDLMFKSEKMLPRELNNTALHYQVNFLTSMVSNMLNQRLSDLAKNPEATFISGDVEVGQFFVSPTKDAVTLEGVAKGNDIIPALKDLYRELLRAQRGGFTQSEYDRARSEYLSAVERNYNNRNDRVTSSYSREYANAFTNNEPCPDMELELQIINSFAPSMPLEAINSLLSDMMGEDNRVFLAMLPDNGTMLIPTEEQIAAALAEVEAEQIEPYRDAMREDPLIPELPTPGAITGETHNALWDATEFTLSNGVKVIVKQTKFKQDEILFQAIAKGGTSGFDTAQAASNVMLPYFINANGLGLYTNSDVEKYLQGKQVSLQITPSTYTREVSGSSTVKDLPTLFELIYMTFTGYTIDETEFEGFRKMLETAISSQVSTPEFQFNTVILDDLFKSPNSKFMSPEAIEGTNREYIIDVAKKMTANAADYTFVFVGNVDLDALRPLLCQYIATLPADAAKATTAIVNNPDVEFPTGTATHQHYTSMQTPQSWVFVGFGGSAPYNTRNTILTNIASKIIGDRLLKQVREEMGATYSIGCAAGFSRVNTNNAMFQIPFPMKPELKDETLPIIRQIIGEVAAGITPEELESAKGFIVKNATAALEKNSPWLDAICSTTLNGVPTFLDTADVAATVTAEEVQKFLSDILAQENYIQILLDATPAE